MITLKTIGRNAVLFAIGGTIYYMIELIWRGYILEEIRSLRLSAKIS